MKNLIFYLFSFIFPLAIFAQGNTSPSPITDVVFDQQFPYRIHPQIRGKVIHASPSDLESITIKYSVVNVGNPFQTSYNTKLAPDGTFRILMPEKLMNQQIWFRLGEYAYTCLYIDEDLELIFDLTQLKQNPVYLNGVGIMFAGTDGAKNQIMNDYILFNKKHNADFSKQVNSLDQESSNYISMLDSMFAVQHHMNTEFYSQYGDAYQYLIQSETQSSYFESKLDYLCKNEILVDDIQELLIPIYAISNESRSYIQKLAYYMRSYFSSTGKKYSYANLANFCDSILPPVYADLIKLQFENRDVKLQRDLYEELKPSLHFNWTRDYISSQITLLNNKVLKIDSINQASIVTAPLESILGKQILKTSSGALLYVDEHKTGDELLQDLKKLFPNKLVIIDIWATWCIPCIQAMPYGKELYKQAQTANLPIEFVYLCTSSGSGQKLWENKVLEIDQPGTHLFVQNKVLSEVMRLFNKGGYPSYIMLNPDGSYDSETITSMRHLSLDMLKAKL